MNCRYIRVSSITQNDARQIAKKHNDELLFIDKVSGSIPFIKRENAKLLIEQVKKWKY
jgi:hypothetical protein